MAPGSGLQAPGQSGRRSLGPKQSLESDVKTGRAGYSRPTGLSHDPCEFVGVAFRRPSAGRDLRPAETTQD
jgi:hypothetical protein